MSRRSHPYPNHGSILRIPDTVWTAALKVMTEYAVLGGERHRRGSEALVYLGGVVTDEEILVTTLYCLEHEPQGDRVVVTELEARWLLRALRARDEKLIGQIHSHRGIAGHSIGDDLHATSFHDGFLSVVVPDFGASVTAISHCAVLEFHSGRFVELTAAEIKHRLRIDAQIVRRESDAKIASATYPTVPTQESPWTRFAQRLRSIARKQRSQSAA